MSHTENLVARVLTLAASGRYSKTSELLVAMLKEGYSRSTVQPLLEGAAFREQVRRMMREAPRPVSRAGPSGGEAEA